MPMTDAEKTAFLQVVTGYIDGLPAPAAPAVLWFEDTSSPPPTEPLTDLTNVAEIKRYMAHGFKPNLQRGVAESDWPKYLALAKAVYTATLPQIADMLVRGAEFLDSDTAVELLLGGGTQGSTFTSLSFYVAQPTVPDISHAAAWLTGATGLGPSGQ